MKTIIAGSRTIEDYRLVEDAVKRCGWTITEVVSGTADGADKLGEAWARNHKIPVKQFKPDWNKFNKQAGILRNVEMAKYAEALIALWDNVSKGTKHMIDEANRRGLKVFVYYDTRARICGACECRIDNDGGCGCNPPDA